MITKRFSWCLFAAGAAFAGDLYHSAGFLQFPDSVKMGALSSVAVAANGHLYVLHRGSPPLLEFDAGRHYVRGWGEGMFKVAHGLRVDKAENIWTTDNGNHVVRKFSSQGELLLTLGQVDAGGAGKDRFRSPDDIIMDSHGALYVADSGNGRIVKLDASGAYLAEWGTKGSEPGQFKMAHGLAIDARDRIYVADRGNNRVQVFTPEGKLVAVWTGFGNPYGLLVAGSELLISEGEAHKIFHLDLDGKIKTSWGGPSVLQLPHFMAMDGKGNLLVAEVNGQRVQIFTRGEHGTQLQRP